jgi:STE24 endopeptidase
VTEVVQRIPRSAQHDTHERAVRYSRTREALALAAMAAGWLFDAGVLFGGASARLRASAGRWTSRPFLADALYLLLFRLLARAVMLPLAYVRGYVVEHRYRLSNQDHRGWLVDQAKATALGLAFELPITLAAYTVIRRSPRRWWVILSGLALPFTVLTAQLYPVLIAPIFNKYVPLRDGALAERVRRLAERAGVRVADVVEMDMSRQTRKANAFFAGIGPTKRIALGDTLVAEFTPDEISVVVAHELGHQIHRDIWKGVALGSLVTLGGALALSRLGPVALARSRHRSGVADLGDVASLPLLWLLMGLIDVLAMPLANAFSRNLVERPADRYALELTGQPDAFASAMEKLARQNLSDPDPPRLIHLLLHSHPSVKERVAMARGWRRP